MSELSHERLLDLVEYDPLTGEFRWRVSGKTATAASRRHGYKYIDIDGRSYYAGRIAFFYMIGRWPEPTVDHDNKIRDDDRWMNLKEATYSVQLNNRHRLPSNTSDGVSKRSDGKWRARVNIGPNKRVSLGSFPSRESAQVARDNYLERHKETIDPLEYSRYSRSKRLSPQHPDPYYQDD